MLNPPPNISDSIRAKVEKDLNPDPAVVHAKLGLACLGGGVLSLLVCGQFGIAFTPTAQNISHFIHQNMNPLVCAMICGVMYSLFPVVVMRVVLTSPLEFKAILNQYRITIAAWYIISGVSMASFGHHGNDFVSVLIWTIAAIVGAHIISRTVSLFMPIWSLREKLNFGL